MSGETEPREFAVILPSGVRLRVNDLPLDVLHDVERAAGTRWPSIIAAPAATAGAAKALYEMACKHAGEEPEVLTARRLLDGEVFVSVGDDLPTMFEDGVPAPKAEAEIPTDGSSGELDGSDGPPT